MIQEYKRIADIKRLGFIVDQLNTHVPAGGAVLDVGCGNGIISRGIAREGFNVQGIDISEKAIMKARSLTDISNVKFDVISAEELVADGKVYDAVICSEVLEHLHHPEKLLSVLYKVLAEDGILIVTVPNGRGPREVLITRPIIFLQKKNDWRWKAVQKLKKTLGFKGTTVQSDADDLTHVQFFTKKNMENMAGEHRFFIQTFANTDFIEDVFPFSLLSKRFLFLQKIDCAVADMLPYQMTSGFASVWKKKKAE